MALKWTKTSSPLAVVMKPKPFASLNHLTVPVLRMCNFLLLSRLRVTRTNGHYCNIISAGGRGRDLWRNAASKGETKRRFRMRRLLPALLLLAALPATAALKWNDTLRDVYVNGALT